MKPRASLASVLFSLIAGSLAHAARERSHIVPAGSAGFYAIEDSSLRVDPTHRGRIPLRVWAHRVGVAEDRQAEPAVATSLEPGEFFDFDTFLGYLDAGDTIQVRLGGETNSAGLNHHSQLDFKVVRTPLIPVSVFPEDFANPGASPLTAPGAWSVAHDLPAGSAAARHLASSRRDAVRLVLPSDASRESVVIFRAPHSGTYALHEAGFRTNAPRVEARIYIGHESAPRRAFSSTSPAALISLNTDLGYVAKGDTITIAFAQLSDPAAPATIDTTATVDFTGTLVEWAPRRAPLRVHRGADGRLDVFEPEAPRRRIDIPAAQWIDVPAPANGADATEAIRAALTAAIAAQKNSNDYAGVRLAPGQTYLVASAQTGGAIFSVRDARRLVFDGRGATLLVSSPELARREVTLFSVLNSREIAFADFTVKASTVPFTTGEVLSVTPPNANSQTVTFRVTPGALDPIREISRNGQSDAYAYDPLIPGRLAVGSWTHYPGRGNPPLQATAQPGVFSHGVTRTGNSIKVGDKWLVKNKRGGVIYLSTRGTTENVTLSGVVGLASGGGHLRFSPSSGINLLDCRFEPDGEDWIGSSADSVHGRGREGPWIENTLIRGICEDVMNTYGQSLVVIPDDDPADAIMSIRHFDGSVESTRPASIRPLSSDAILRGDQLVFFNPKTGRVLGYAKATALANGRVTLSNSIADIDTWEPGESRSVTMVYNTRVAARFFVRDSRIMDSMRFGIYIKARGGVIFGSQFEGLSAPSILATNEPEWPEGPPATHLWLQGCTFSQNNYGYMSRRRAFMVVDPADVSIYTRRLRDPAEPAGYTAHLTRGQYANAHLKLVGNVFHDWRGMGMAVRNSRNVLIRDNLFLPPVEDLVMRQTLAKDPALARDGRGHFATIFLSSVDGVRVTGNRAYGLPTGDHAIVREPDATGVIEDDNTSTSLPGAGPAVALSFGEWFGPASVETASVGSARDRVEMHGAVHRAGRLGGGLFFDGKSAPAVLANSIDAGGHAAPQLSVAMWVEPAPGGGDAATQILHAQGDHQHGLVLAIDRGRFVVGLWQGTSGAWLDLGPATIGLWQNLALVYDGPAQTLRGFVDGREVAVSSQNLPAQLEPLANATSFGGATTESRLGGERLVAAGSSAYHGGLDEFHRFPRAIDSAEVSLLALRRPAALVGKN